MSPDEALPSAPSVAQAAGSAPAAPAGPPAPAPVQPVPAPATMPSAHVEHPKAGRFTTLLIKLHIRKAAESQMERRMQKRVERKDGKIKSLFVSIGHIGMGKERTGFIQNVATLLNAGLPLVDSLQTIRHESRVKPMKKLMQRLIDDVESGSPLWKAMESQHFFTPYAIALVRIGEEAGNLARNMEYLSEQQEKDHALKSKVKMAMIYPIIILVLVLVVIIGLGGFVLPNLVPVLHSLGTELPIVTRIVIKISDFFSTQSVVFIPSLLGVFVALFLLHSLTRFKVVTQWAIFRIPGIGRLAREATVARFGVILGGLLKAGVPLTEAINSLAEVTSLECYRKFYFHLRDSIALGQTFKRSFEAVHRSDKLLPYSVQELVVVGERSGSLADVLLKIADIYDHKASETAQKLPVILEPLLLLFMGGLVGTIAFAIIMPIYDVVGNVGR